MLELIGRDGYLYLSKRIVRAWTDHRPDATATSLREHMFPLDILPVLFRGEIRGGGLVLKPEWCVHDICTRYHAVPYVDPIAVADANTSAKWDRN